MKKIKRLLSLLLVSAVCLTLLLSCLSPIPSRATAGSARSTLVDSGKCGANLTWELYSGGVLLISGIGSMYDYSVEFSDYFEPWAESSTAPWAVYYVSSVAIQEGVTTHQSPLDFCHMINK